MKTSHPYMRNGFSLIEAAVILVLIGIMIGAFIKVSALVDRTKSISLVHWVDGWETSAKLFQERKNRLPGDYERNWLIGDTPLERAERSAVREIEAALNAPPSEWLILSPQFVIPARFGFIGPQMPPIPQKNAFIIAHREHGKMLTEEEKNYLRYLDLEIDGKEDGRSGRVLALAVVYGRHKKNWLHFAAGSTNQTTEWDTPIQGAAILLEE